MLVTVISKNIFFNYVAELQINKATMVLSLDRCLSYIWSVRDFSRSLHMRQISIIGSILNIDKTRFSENWQANLKGSGRMLPWETFTLYVAKHAISRISVSSVTENELFIIIKLIVPSSPVWPLEYYFLLETSQSLNFIVLLYVNKS